MTNPHRLAAPLIACSLLGSVETARAAPQWNVALTASGCLVGARNAAFERVAFCGQTRGDVLFLRHRVSDFGFGPYVALGTAGFEDLRFSGGGSALLPVAADFPLVVSLGLLARERGDFGLSSSLFWGPRSYNFHAGYNLAFGFCLAAERTVGAEASNALSLGFQADAFVLALPVLLIAGVLR